MYLFSLNFFIFCFLLLKASYILPSELTDHWIVWNTGQGQWVTHVTNDICRHYDVGGEVGRFQAVRSRLIHFCQARDNQIVLSHWDFDHYVHIPALAKVMPRVCWLSQPDAETNKSTAQAIINLRIRPCNENLFLVTRGGAQKWRPLKSKTTNESSGVFVEQNILLPGDSPITQEKKWIHEIGNLDQVRVLILGHHGSRTSTGVDLLQHLKKLKMTVASARFAKYHHPHPSTLQRIRNRGVPVLKTEDWGNIHF